MTIDSADILILTSIFVIPGYIIDTIRCRFSAETKDNDSESFYKYLVYSCASNAFSSYFVYELLVAKLYGSKPLLAVAYFVLTVFIVPTILGICLSVEAKHEFFVNILKKLGLVGKHSTSTGWNRFFSNTYGNFDPNTYARIGLSSGKEVLVQFGMNSYISESGTDDGDIYVSIVYHEDGDDWIVVEESPGIIIPKASIEFIKFVRRKESENGR